MKTQRQNRLTATAGKSKTRQKLLPITRTLQLFSSDFDPKFAYDVLLPLADAAYLPDLKVGDPLIPANYSVIGKITMDQAKAFSLTRSNPNNRKLIQVLLKDGNFFGWVMKNAQEKTIAVAFRGTQSLDDWLHNIEFSKTDYEPVNDYGQVHDGFYVYYMSIRDCLLNLLEPTVSACERLILTGHSLGAALSELAAPDLLYNVFIGSVLPEVQNFAGPRPGDSDFANMFDIEINKCFRVVNIWDVVPHVPPALLGFEHVGNTVLIDGGFTDFLDAHKLEMGYKQGLKKLIPNPQTKAISIAARKFPNAVVVGRSS